MGTEPRTFDWSGFFATLAFGAVVTGVGAWWIWSSQRSGGDSPLAARIVFGIGLGLLAVAVYGGLAQTMAGRGVVLTVLAVGVLVVSAGAAVLSYRAFTQWAGSPQKMVQDVGAVCVTGKGLQEAAPLPAPPPLHAVVVGDHGQQIEWSGQDASWRAASVADTELVACASFARTLVETCTYHPLRHPGTLVDVTRFRSVVTARVLAAHTGRQVGTFTVANEPRPCQPEETDTSIETPVTFEQVSSRLEALSRAGRGSA